MIASLFAFLFVYVQALMVNYLVNEYRLTTRQSFLSAMSYILITSLVPEWSYLSPSLVAATLVIWSFVKLFRLYNLASASSLIYNIGLIIGLSSFIFFPSLFFGVCLLLGLMILRPFRLNEIFLFLLGVATPYYFFAIYLYLTNGFNVHKLLPAISLQMREAGGTIWLVVTMVLLVVPFLAGGYYIQSHLRKMLIQVRKNWSILLFYLLIGLFIPFINNSHSLHNWILVVAPFAAFHTCVYLYPSRKWVPLTLFSITLIAILLQQYVTHTWHS
jgi:hypothetical protein